MVSRFLSKALASKTAARASCLDYKDIQPALLPYKSRLLAHPIYESIQEANQLQVFMESHAFAVWDFMTLLKSLQMRLTCVSLPWVPPNNPELAYFINSIVLGEEADDFGTQDFRRATSHYDLYLESMKEVGANYNGINFLVNRIQGGVTWQNALNETRSKFPSIPSNTFDFVEYTMMVAEEKDTHEIASYFLFGREDPIPNMYRKIVQRFDNQDLSCNNFKMYLERHIEVDGDAHAPMADIMLEKLCTNSKKCEEALIMGQKSIEMRLHLWDGIYSKIK
jgi:hypothetical protein